MVRTIQNYVNGAVGESDTDCDVTVDYEYSAGRLVTMTAYNAKGTGNGVEAQVTAYLYESTINASWQTAAIYPDSEDGHDVASLTQTSGTATLDTADSHGLTTGDWVYVLGADQPEYNGRVQVTVVDADTFSYSVASGAATPATGAIRVYDPTGGDQVKTTYDRLGRVVATTDQRGVRHEYVFDATTGRLTDDCVPSRGSSGVVDEAILRITTTYDDVGRVQSVASYDDPDPGEGNVVNEVEYVYNGWGQVAREYQEHDGPVDGNTLFVQYDYADGAVGTAAKYVRLDQVTYPNGREVHYDYGTTGAIDDIMSRLATIGDGANTHASYKYLGAGRIVTEDYEDIDVKLDYSANNFAALDRFGRVVDQVWKDYSGTPTAIDEYTYGYDEAGNRTSRDNEKEGTLDEDYLYDDLDRLSEWRLDGVSQKTWNNLDGLGNDLDTGTYNAANEMTPTVGSSGYDAAGNMTTLQSGDTAVYDAWNRLVEVDDGETIVERNEFDGTNRRIQVFSDFDVATPDKVVDDYHTGVQTIESDVTVDGNRDGGYQTIWSPRYIDSAILRDTLNTAGTAIVAAERVFYLADANYNVTGLVKYNPGTTDWEVAERYTYTPYGEVTYRTAAWTTTGSSANANTTLYTGRELDLLTDIYYYRARYYDAHLERFVGRDPIGYEGRDANLYRYVAANPVIATDPFGLEQRRQWKSDAERKQAICEAIRNSDSLEDFINKYDPTWGGENGGDLFNLDFDTPGYGNIDVDWMITLLAAHEGRTPGLGGWLLEGRDPGIIYDVGKRIWIIQDALTDPNVDIDWSRLNQANELAAVRAARDLLDGKITLEELFGINCDDIDNDSCPQSGSEQDRNEQRRRNDRGRRNRRGRDTRYRRNPGTDVLPVTFAYTIHDR